MSRSFLYRRSGWAVIILWLLAVMAPPSAAPQDKPQLKRPLDIPEEKLPEGKKPKKNVKGPRAVGLLQLTASGKGTLIPIAILIDGKFYDASAYKADPVPMALDSGTVYEAEQAGDSLGLFTVEWSAAQQRLRAARIRGWARVLTCRMERRLRRPRAKQKTCLSGSAAAAAAMNRRG